MELESEVSVKKFMAAFTAMVESGRGQQGQVWRLGQRAIDVSRVSESHNDKSLAFSGVQRSAELRRRWCSLQAAAHKGHFYLSAPTSMPKTKGFKDDLHFRAMVSAVFGGERLFVLRSQLFDRN